MANLSEDIQCVGSDTRAPMLDRTDFASWEQRIRLYCRGKENEVNILKSIDEGPFQMGTFRETLAEGDEGALHLGPERPRVYSDLSHEDKDRYNANIWATNILLQGLPKYIYSLINHYTDAKDIWDNVKMLLEGTAGYGGALNRVGNANLGQARQDLALNMDNVFQADDCDAFDSDVDEAPTVQTMFIANLSSADPVYDEANPSYDSDILSEVYDHDHYQDAVCEHHEEHEMHDDVQPNYVVDSHADYTSNSNMILYDQYVKDNAVPVVQSNVSSVTNDAYMMIYNDMCEPHAQSVSKTTRNIVVDNSLTAELETYKEQVELYERRARFELTEREQKIDEQLRIVITDRNIKEENLKKELHSVKLQLASTINHNKSMVEEVTSLKKDFKQKENKYLEEFLDMKALKEKVEDRLYKQDQSLQTVHMLCKPKPYYNELNKVAIGYKNPLCLTRAKQVQPALYNGYEIVKNNHVPAIVHNTEDTLEIAEITRRKMHDKMKDPECVTHKVKIAPPDYSKENYLATFTPQKQLTSKKIFWSQDIIKMKAEALKEQTTASRPTKALTVYSPNTPATLVPRVLPTKSQVKINIFALIQLFSDFEKTCNKRITPTGLTEGKRGFEQTKACYLTEVIPFFKILKEHFESIQKALTKEVKEMKEIFEELEAEVDQHVVDRKHDEIERKNLLIANDNLIADCLFKDVFHVATNSELNLKYQNLKESFGNNTSSPTQDVPDFDLVIVIEKIKASIQGKDNAIKKLRMHISQLNETSSEADRIRDFRTLDFQITQLTEKINVLQEQNELFKVKNGKIKQHYKELYDFIKITGAMHLEQTTALLTENESLKVQIHNKLSCVNKDHAKPKVLAPGKYAIDVEPIPPGNKNNREVHLVYLKHLKESVETLREIVEEAKVKRPLDSSLASACHYTKHSQELLECVIDTCLKVLNTQNNKHASTSLPKKNCTDASESQPRSNTKKNRILPAKSVNMKKVEEHPWTIKSSLKTMNRVDSSISSKRIVVHIILWYLDSGCSKHMIGDRSRLRNFVKKFIGTVRFGNDHFGAIMGYGDYVIGESVISRVYYMEGLGHNLFSVGQFCDSNLKVAFRKHFCYVRDTDGVELIKGKGKEPRRIMETIHVQFDEPTEQMAPVQLNTGPAPTFLTTGQISSGLVPNPVPAAPYVPPINKDLEILFQPILHQGVAAESPLMEDNPFVPIDNDHFINVFPPKPRSEASSFEDLSSTESPYVSQTLHHLRK
ncbi:hypothetical protein Tco_0448582 [Tanacetum coccineum]